jgi:enoyl-CoA hydratase/carnithine racemase
MPAHETLRVEHHGSVAVVTLDRPQRLNAYTAKMGVELFGALAELDAATEIRAIVVTGSGRAFCAGADLHEVRFAASEFDASREVESRMRPWRASTPILAALNGPAVGVGATLPLQWDLRIASDRATIAFPFVRRGLTPEAGSSWILPRLVGMSVALDLLLTGRTVDAREALALGLVSRVVEHERLMGEVMAIARDIAEHASPSAVAATKRLLWRHAMDGDAERAREREEAVFAWAGAREDVAEGVRAFLDKRAPRFSPAVEAAPALERDDD